jgi:purine-cytosine permease-like protein
MSATTGPPGSREKPKEMTSVGPRCPRCVALISGVLVQGFFGSADLIVKLEAVAGLFVLGCVLLLASRRSGRAKKPGAES